MNGFIFVVALFHQSGFDFLACFMKLFFGKRQPLQTPLFSRLLHYQLHGYQLLLTLVSLLSFRAYTSIKYRYLTYTLHVITIVITMQSTIIQIGNSRGVRLPKEVLILSGIKKNIEIKVKRGEIKIVPAKENGVRDDFAFTSEESFAKDWLRPEEEEAWKAYQ